MVGPKLLLCLCLVANSFSSLLLTMSLSGSQTVALKLESQASDVAYESQANSVSPALIPSIAFITCSAFSTSQMAFISFRMQSCFWCAVQQTAAIWCSGSKCWWMNSSWIMCLSTHWFILCILSLFFQHLAYSKNSIVKNVH